MGAVGDTVDAVELKNGVVSDLSPLARLQMKMRIFVIFFSLTAELNN